MEIQIGATLPTMWISATYFDAPPTTIARRWWKIVAPSFTPPGAPPRHIATLQNRSGTLVPVGVEIETRQVPLANGGSRLQGRMLMHDLPGHLPPQGDPG